MIHLKIKSIKDTIHGYIRIEEPFWKIIDTAEFQRLKWVEQTSYRVLYPSARHDRFIHSIGVYHLGQKAITGFIKNCNHDDSKVIKEFRNSFLLGCILHDLGHAPFSHTCEDLYNYQEKITNPSCSLNAILFESYKNSSNDVVFERFKKDYTYILNSTDGICKAPSEHEVMSAVLTIKNFDKFKSFFEEGASLDLDLVIRSILGCVYAVAAGDEQDQKQISGIKNCLIRLLNSSTVDVDKLDYIARDTQMSGYDNIVLDNERLLDSTCIVINNDGIYLPAFKKSALSIINNVILAKNSQAQWIVNHPIVLYDAYLLRRAIGISVKNIYDKQFTDSENISSFDILLKKIFSYGALSKDGICVDNNEIKLLSDIELLNWMKQNINNPCVSEYFSRDERKSPIWKSNEEFLFHLNSDKDKAKEISDFIAPLITYLNKIEDLYLSKEISSALNEKIATEEIDGKDELIKIVDSLTSYEDADGNAGFEYVILPAKNSFFTKINAKNINIRFGDNEKEYTSYENIRDNTFELTSKTYEFFYLYSNKKIDVKHFLNYLYSKAHASSYIRA